MTDTDDNRPVRPFAAVLQELNRGEVHDTLSQDLRDLVDAVTETGKKGTITVKIEVKPIKPGQTDALVVTATVTTNQPQVETPTTVFFVDRGNLTRDDPNTVNQLPLRGLTNNTQEENAA